MFFNAASESCVTHDEQSNGFEVSGYPSSTNTAGECSTLCNENSDCNFWRWHPEDTGWENAK